jgi:putative flippase GtrA
MLSTKMKSLLRTVLFFGCFAAASVAFVYGMATAVPLCVLHSSMVVAALAALAFFGLSVIVGGEPLRRWLRGE